eukprot:GEMP01006465.1.p1 GENE.GEMP01006465.1~~GEMP01006465.1.p1  ORF type:complete len:788 (+),score=160.79 GEMP01006465.1:3-2366(+)
MHNQCPRAPRKARGGRVMRDSLDELSSVIRPNLLGDDDHRTAASSSTSLPLLRSPEIRVPDLGGPDKARLQPQYRHEISQNGGPSLRSHAFSPNTLHSSHSRHEWSAHHRAAQIASHEPYFIHHTSSSSTQPVEIARSRSPRVGVPYGYAPGMQVVNGCFPVQHIQGSGQFLSTGATQHLAPQYPLHTLRSPVLPAQASSLPLHTGCAVHVHNPVCETSHWNRNLPPVVYCPRISHEDLTQVNVEETAHIDSPLAAQRADAVDDTAGADKGHTGLIKKVWNYFVPKAPDTNNETEKRDRQRSRSPPLTSSDSRRVLPHEDPSKLFRAQCGKNDSLEDELDCALPEDLQNMRRRHSDHDSRKPELVVPVGVEDELNGAVIDNVSESTRRRRFSNRSSFHSFDDNSPLGNNTFGQSPLCDRRLSIEPPLYPKDAHNAPVDPSSPRARSPQLDEMGASPPRKQRRMSPNGDGEPSCGVESPFRDCGGPRPMGLNERQRSPRIDLIHVTPGTLCAMGPNSTYQPLGFYEPDPMPTAPLPPPFAPKKAHPQGINNGVLFPESRDPATASAAITPGVSSACVSGTLTTNARDGTLNLPRRKTVENTMHNDLLWMQSRESIETETLFHVAMENLKTLENEWDDDPAELEAFRFISKRMKDLITSHRDRTKIDDRKEYCDTKDSLEALQREKKRLEDEKKYWTSSKPIASATEWKPKATDLPAPDHMAHTKIELKKLMWNQEALSHMQKCMHAKLEREKVKIKVAMDGLQHLFIPTGNGITTESTTRSVPHRRVL